ncbi:MAG: RNA polymerase sigma factor [Phycisphaerales bacterium JB059]
MPWITTTILLDRLTEAQDSAWEELASHFRGPVLAFALRMGLSHPAAEDVVQSTMLAFLRAYRDGRYDKQRGRLSSWLFGIAYREALRSIREGARERQAPGETGRTTFFSGQPDDDLAQRSWADEWGRHVLDRCMEQARAEVEPRTYEAFELSAIRNVPVDQVVAELGMTRNAVFIAKHRVLKRIAQLQREYEPEEVTP